MQVGIRTTAVEFPDGIKGPALGIQRVDADHQFLQPIGYNSGIAQIIPAKYISVLLRSNQIQFNDLQSEQLGKDQPQKEQHQK